MSNPLTLTRRYAVAIEAEYRRRKTSGRARRGELPPTAWRDWLHALFPQHFTHPLAERHVDLWRWVLAIKLGEPARPFVGVWPRGGGKSTTAEAAVVALGARNRRRYALYIRETQDQADKSVANIAALLESSTIARYYLEHAERKVGKFGNSKGWRREQLRTAGGLTVDALGLDAAARGVKVEEQRPDLIIFDDIDDLLDSPATTKRKTETITKSILPAGSNDVAVLFIQNLIIRDGVASQLADGRADFLAKRIVSGPYPAVDGLKTEWRLDEETGTRHAAIVAGTATWEGQNLATCQRNIDQWGLSAFLKEAQHRVKDRAAGVALKVDPQRHYLDLDDEQTRRLVQTAKCFAGIDPQWWRFGFTLWAMTTKGVVIRVQELFSQKESLAVRAMKMHELCLLAGIDEPSPKTCPIWADAANPQDIAELNLAFRNGWPALDDEGRPTGEITTSKLRVLKVANENKLRVTAVQRINDRLDRNAILFRRAVGGPTYMLGKEPGPATMLASGAWMYGQNAQSEGTEIKGSRLLWEMDNWAVVSPKEGEAQEDNPDDDTADGADMIASLRYAIMSATQPPKPRTEDDRVPHIDDVAEPFDYARREFKEHPHVVDVFSEQSRRTPSIRMPRPRVGR